MMHEPFMRALKILSPLTEAVLQDLVENESPNGAFLRTVKALDKKSPSKSSLITAVAALT